MNVKKDNQEFKFKVKNQVAYRAKIYGIVQGVGFRPYVYKKAKEFSISGFVNNMDSFLIVTAEGTKEKVKDFFLDIVKKPPELAKIEKVEIRKEEIKAFTNFTIRESENSNTKLKFILPDVATCNKCREDILNKDSKRYRYAFTNCTLCGPRYSVIKSLPYDRCNTTMGDFKMCKICDREYKNPDTRRFHAEPTCCKDCGPKLILTDKRGNKVQCLDEIKECAKLIKEGKIIGIKGIGGFHIVCSALNEEAVLRIRNGKKRKDKPFALMLKDIEEVKKYCQISKTETNILESKIRPIVLLRKKNQKNIAKNVAPKVNKYGVMLPYTPIHYLLFNEEIEPLVMTSGNVSGNPIEYTNKGALENLHKIVDYFLLNDREINTPIDDSVVKVVEDKVTVIRPGRGIAPYYIMGKIKNKILAFGAEMKSTFSFSLDGIAYMSQYFGDLKQLNSYEEYVKAIKNMKSIFELKEEIISFDRHPGYMSSFYGKSLNALKEPVYHHHAHMASCLLEHDIDKEVIGIIYDGTGLGDDGNIWGGEFLIGDRKNFKRAGHFKYVKIQGGDSSNVDIWKIASSYLKALEDKWTMDFGLNRMKKLLKDDLEVDNLCYAIDNNINCYKTSSLGRLFDGVAAILDIELKASYDAEGAIELEGIIDESVKESYEYTIESEEDQYIVNYNPMLLGILKDIKNRENKGKISAKFHNTIVKISINMATKLREKFNINRVVLSGGVFENIYILKNIYKALSIKGFEVYFNEKIPTNDSGISLGQVAIADSRH
ncbi:carbamoyltransferase HypF [Haloimpatiens sp. FM7315]|uniref:carbamoyltransferase HypF n=1 Tax=Haloimpatiens sp. FM7315 TaxID=3298609 RepID=UPI00370AF41F